MRGQVVEVERALARLGLDIFAADRLGDREQSAAALDGVDVAQNAAQAP